MKESHKKMPKSRDTSQFPLSFTIDLKTLEIQNLCQKDDNRPITMPKFTAPTTFFTLFLVGLAILHQPSAQAESTAKKNTSNYDSAEASTKIADLSLLRSFASYETPPELPSDVTMPTKASVLYYNRTLVNELTKGDEFNFYIPQLDKTFIATVTRLDKSSPPTKLVQAKFEVEQMPFYLSIMQDEEISDIEISTHEGLFIVEAYGEISFIATEDDFNQAY